jgi:hypothetical protein
MSTGVNRWGGGGGVKTAGATCMCQLSRNSGSLRACTGIVLPSPYAVYNSQTTSTLMPKDEVLSYTVMSLTVSEITFGRCSCFVAIVFYLNSVPENNYVANSASN